MKSYEEIIGTKEFAIENLTSVTMSVLPMDLIQKHGFEKEGSQI